MIVGGGEAWQDGFAAPVKEQEIGRRWLQGER
jgi:hypothetical protein